MSENGVAEVPEPSPFRGDASRLLFVGRLNPFKAADIALRAVSRLPHEVTLTIVGDGTERERLERLATELGIANRVFFVGHVPHSKVGRYYSQAGAFLFPSVRESGGGVVLEAMSYGLPCVVSDWGGPPLYTRDTGVHCRVDNPQVLEDDIVSALRGFLDDPNRARAIGDASRDAVIRDYLWDEKVRRIDQLAFQAIERESITRSARRGNDRGWP
jgi:glycosyltransferase involved in cell wall biosynthesis